MTTVTEWGIINGLDGPDAESLEILALENRKLLDIAAVNGHKGIKARNYVGVIGFADGRYLEILPKVGSNDSTRRRILTDMLRTVHDISSERSDMTGIRENESNIFEFLISMFIEETERVIRKGLHRSYHQYQSNEPYLKGKIIHQEDIRLNSAMRNRFFVEYEIFDHDCPENRIIKSTLKKLLRCSQNDSNRKDIRRLLENFNSIEESYDHKGDFQRCIKTRNTMHYTLLLSWCRLFLDDLGMDPYHGDNLSFVFLFPMEKVYERYVAKILHDMMPEDWIVSDQDRSIPLFDSGKCQLIPDIYLRHNERIFILDTKWKVADGEEKVKESDLYQMYVYSKKFKTNRTVLVYPETIDCDFSDSENGVSIITKRFDVENVDASSNELKEFLLNLR